MTRDTPHLSGPAREVWAKSDRDAEAGAWLPLYRHMSDAAAVAGLLWDGWLPESVRRVIADGRPLEQGRRLAVWLAGAHDLGKVTPAFAVQVRGLADRMHAAGLRMPAVVQDRSLAPHATASHVLLVRWLAHRAGMSQAVADSYAVVVGGHHGVPPGAADLEDADRPHLLGAGLWLDVQTELADYAADLAGVLPDLRAAPGRPLGGRAQVLLTALVIVADWLASYPELFGYDDPSGGRERAESAMEAVGLTAPWQASRPALADLDPLLRSRFELPATVRARPVQQTVVELAASVDEPGLLVVEAPMGEGKTEAALVAAEVLAARTGAGGCFVALPTMATSDAMFARVRRWAGHLPGGSPLSMSLAHGKAALNSDYAQLRRQQFRDVGRDAPDADQVRGGTGGDCTPVVVQWLGGRKKRVLSSMVVGTIDQVLVAALKSRHIVLRHLALASKVVVVDEVHAADAYMAQYLERVLEWLGAYEIPTVVLSATLPAQRRVDLVKAYESGRQRAREAAGGAHQEQQAPQEPQAQPAFWGRWGRGELTPGSDHGQAGPPVAEPERYAALHGDIGYPVVTATTSTGPLVRVCERSGRRSRVRLERLPDDDETLLAFLEAELVGGGCVAVVRNTVDRAQRTAALLRDRHGDDHVMLVHSRFLATDRARLEERLRIELGPPGPEGPGSSAGGRSPERPPKRILVGTQVLEQSLDIDLDLLVTDLAPMDLLLQRIGRLHRHDRPAADRPARLREARAVVVGVADWASEPPVPVAGSEYVYGLAPLLRALAVLDAHGSQLSLPDDIAPLVQAAYAGEPTVPDDWQATFEEAEQAYLQDLERRRKEADTYRLGQPPEPGGTLVDWLKAGVGDADDSVDGQKAVRDSEDAIEVVVVERTPSSPAGSGEAELRALPWLDAPHGGAVLSIEAEPPWPLARELAASTVRLPGWLSSPWLVDPVIGALEADGLAAWQTSPWLRGQLVLALTRDRSTATAEEPDGLLTADVAGVRITYSRRDGLVATRPEGAPR